MLHVFFIYEIIAYLFKKIVGKSPIFIEREALTLLKKEHKLHQLYAISCTQQSRQREPSVKTLRSPQ